MFMDDQERQELIIEHMPQVKYIAQGILAKLPSHFELEDLVSTGVLGLLDAIKKFEPVQGVKFKTYAEFRIKGAILDSLRNLDWAPRSLRKRIKDSEKANSELCAELGRPPTNNELADRMKISIENLDEILSEAVSLNVGSLDQLFEDEKDNKKRKWDDIVRAPADLEDANNSLLRYQENELRDSLLNEIIRLPSKEQRVIFNYYYQELTMNTIGSLMGVHESRISQLHTKAIDHLKRRLDYLNGGLVPLRRRVSVNINLVRYGN